jgi:LPS-assembly lipoprotein
MRSIIKTALWLSVIIMSMCLMSCGFHFKKSVELPPEIHQLAIEDLPTGSELAPVIQLRLRHNGIRTLNSSNDAKLVLYLQSESYKRRVLTVSGLGQVQEYELVYTVKYSITNVKYSAASIKDQTVVIKRDLRFNPSEVLGSASEEERLKQEMIGTAAEQIIRRIPKATASQKDALKD